MPCFLSELPVAHAPSTLALRLPEHPVRGLLSLLESDDVIFIMISFTN